MNKTKHLFYFLFSIGLLLTINESIIQDSYAGTEDYTEKIKLAATSWANYTSFYNSNETPTDQETLDYDASVVFFTGAVNYLIESDTMTFETSSISDTPFEGPPPGWVTDAVDKWGKGVGSDDEFNRAVVWLIENQIIKPEVISGKQVELEIKNDPDNPYTDPSASYSGPEITIVEEKETASIQSITKDDTNGNGGCLIATATFGSELSPQVQKLREIRDNSLVLTKSGSSFMIGFNQIYYSFSPTIADWERQNPVFKEAVKFTITPLLTSLSILNYVDIDSDEEVLGYGIGIILLNIGMYFVAPALVILKIRKFHV